MENIFLVLHMASNVVNAGHCVIHYKESVLRCLPLKNAEPYLVW